MQPPLFHLYKLIPTRVPWPYRDLDLLVVSLPERVAHYSRLNKSNGVNVPTGVEMLIC